MHRRAAGEIVAPLLQRLVLRREGCQPKLQGSMTTMFTDGEHVRNDKYDVGMSRHAVVQPGCINSAGHGPVCCRCAGTSPDLKVCKDVCEAAGAAEGEDARVSAPGHDYLHESKLVSHGDARQHIRALQHLRRSSYSMWHHT